MTTADAPFIGAHLDLKYLMPAKAHLCQWVSELPRLGVNTLLIEYEDKFPWRQHPFLRAPDAFSEDELRAFLDVARDAGLRLVPLVQTFSHLEFALAHEQLAPLRELPHIHTQINPADPDAIAFVHGLIDEVLSYHEPDEYVHLGADEVWHAGANPANRPRHEKLGAQCYWIEHMRPLMQRVIDLGKRPMVWDDIFWKSPGAIESLDMPRDVVLVSWDYSLTPHNPRCRARLDLYRRAGFDVLGAGCVNWGVMTPTHQHCLDNVTAWAHKVRDEDLQGVMHTAWSAFHVPLAVQVWHLAAANALHANNCASIDLKWEQAFHQEWFDLDGPTLAEALPTLLRDTGTCWEHRCEDLERPTTLPVYGYMDLVMHFNGGNAQRLAQGSYPLDWGRIDHVDILRRKLALLRETLDADSRDRKLAQLEAAYSAADGPLSQLAQRAGGHRSTAEYLHVTNALKLTHTGIVRGLLDGGDVTQNRARWDTLRDPLHAALSAWFEPFSVDRLMSVWWQPTANVLEQEADCPGTP